MKFTRFNIFLIALALISLSVGMFLNISTVEAAFGISPPWVQNDHVLPGTTYEQIINLSRSGTEEEMEVSVRISGDEKLVKWIEIPDQENLIMKSGQSILPMKVIIDIPKRAALKNYRGGIRTSLSPVKKGEGRGGEVAIALGANISVNITVVGDAIMDYEIRSVLIDPIQEGNPYSLKMKVANLGNTEISNIEGKIDIYDKTQANIIKSLDLIALDDPISPDETQISRMIFEDIVLDPGEYWIVIKTFKDGEIAYENRLFQEIVSEVMDIPEDTTQKPALPGDGKEEVVTPSVIQVVPIADLKSAAPAGDETSKVYLIFGLAGLGLGLVAVIGIIVVLIMVLKNQQQVAGKRNQVQNKDEREVN